MARSVARKLSTGVNPSYSEWDMPWADGALDAPGDPGAPITTDLEGAASWGIPWVEGIEDPGYPNDLALLQSADPQYGNPSIGASPIPTAYEPAVRTQGPVTQFGHEVSGGLYGDQAIGRIMRFPANIPDRYDPYGVKTIDYRDELAASLAASSEEIVTDTQVNTELVLLPNYV